MSRQLFEPVRIGPITLRNRTIRAAAFEGMSAGHSPSDQLIAYHRDVAAGGIGMTTVAYAAVDRSGLTFPHQLWLRDEIVPQLRELTDAVHREGACASIQIGHAGNMSPSSLIGERTMAPSAKFNLYGPTWPRAMRAPDIERIVASFGRAARLARESGFDAVEVHAGHGYLISQFLSPFTNRRRDAYGGDLESRMRFMREVMRTVRDAAGLSMAVVVKMNLRDGFDGGLEIDDAIRVARALEACGADALVLSGGFVSRTPMYILRGRSPARVMGRLLGRTPLGLAVSALGELLMPTEPYADLYFLDDAVRLRAAVSLPLVYVGGVTSRASIDRVLGLGFDAVAMARALIEDPAFVSKLAERAGGDSRCDHCNYCVGRIYTTSADCYLRNPPDDSAMLRIVARGSRSS